MSVEPREKFDVMKKLAIAAVCTMSLSGCALPVGVTVATWAADGWSMLTTQKSILDHGISYVSGEDCALWRMFTEDDVCQQEQVETVVADSSAGQSYADGYSDDALADYRSLTQGAGASEYEGARTDDEKLAPQGPVVIASLDSAGSYVPTGGQPWYRKTKNAEYLSLMPESFSAGSKPLSQQAPATARTMTPPAVPVEPVQVEQPTGEAIVASGQTDAPAIDIDFAGAKPVEPAAPRVMANNRHAGETFTAVPGQYFVVGSFSVPENADRFAARHTNLAAHVHEAQVNGGTVYRVVVGPYLDGEVADVSSAIADAGISSTWKLRVNEGSSVAAWLPYDASEVASIAAVPQS